MRLSQCLVLDNMSGPDSGFGSCPSLDRLRELLKDLTRDVQREHCAAAALSRRRVASTPIPNGI